VNVYIPTPSSAPTDALFDSSLETRARPSIRLTFPERPPITGLVDITVFHDIFRPRGIAVEIRGAINASADVDILEEVVRRGGLFGLPGRVWATAHITL
jgi:hypothetical protein